VPEGNTVSLQCGVIVADPANRPGAVRSEVSGISFTELFRSPKRRGVIRAFYYFMSLF